MSKDEIMCDCCGQPMQLVEKLPLKKSKKGGQLYRVRRFFCNLCKIGKTVYAGGFWDDQYEPRKAIEQVQKNYQKEQEARR